MKMPVSQGDAHRHEGEIHDDGLYHPPSVSADEGKCGCQQNGSDGTPKQKPANGVREVPEIRDENAKDIRKEHLHDRVIFCFHCSKFL